MGKQITQSNLSRKETFRTANLQQLELENPKSYDCTNLTPGRLASYLQLSYNKFYSRDRYLYEIIHAIKTIHAVLYLNDKAKISHLYTINGF